MIQEPMHANGITQYCSSQVRGEYSPPLTRPEAGIQFTDPRDDEWLSWPEHSELIPC